MKSNKVALITGASSGIGKEFAIIHAQTGGDLVIVARRADELSSLKQELESKYKINVHTIVKDLSLDNAAQELYNEVKAVGIEIEYLINNAGFGLVGEFHKLPWERQKQMMDLNMGALTQLSYLFLSDFTTRNSGKILNNSSTASLMPGPLQAVYYASKAYVTSLGNAINQELHNTNITVTTLLPGATQSEFGATSGMDKTPLFKNPATAKSVAQQGYNAMLKGKLNIIAGMGLSQRISIAMLAFLPKKSVLKMIYDLQSVK